VLGAVLRDVRGVLSHQHCEQGSSIMTYQLSNFSSFFWVFLRDFIVHSDGVSLIDVGRCIVLYIMDYIVMYLLLLLFFYFMLLYLLI
jgi:hypothetical protein